MIPDTLYLVQNEATESTEPFEVRPTLTYHLDFTNNRIIGKVDKADAVMQSIRKILDTSKYAYEIYDWYYGNELLALVGQPYDYVEAQIPRIVKEALLVDDRILEVTDFTFEKVGVDSMLSTFLIHTVYGNISYTLEVSL